MVKRLTDLYIVKKKKKKKTFETSTIRKVDINNRGEKRSPKREKEPHAWPW